MSTLNSALLSNETSLDGMFEPSNKRKASKSPQSTEKSKKDKKAAKKEQKSREKIKQRSKLQLDIPPSTAQLWVIVQKIIDLELAVTCQATELKYKITVFLEIIVGLV